MSPTLSGGTGVLALFKPGDSVHASYPTGALIHQNPAPTKHLYSCITVPGKVFAPLILTDRLTDQPTNRLTDRSTDIVTYFLLKLVQ